jgi:hypothetical protein
VSVRVLEATIAVALLRVVVARADRSCNAWGHAAITIVAETHVREQERRLPAAGGGRMGGEGL